MNQQIEVLYGKGSLPVAVSDDSRTTLVRKPPMPVIENPDVAVKSALGRSVGLPNRNMSLSSMASQASSACIVICDITRPVPNHLFLRPTIEILMDAGISQKKICVLIATGLHRPNLGNELAELIGDPWVLENISILNHDALSDVDNVDLGKTPHRKVPIKLNRRLVEADLRIVSGLVEPHFMAGYSGGRKVIAPGVAHADTIRTFHNYKFMSDPAADNCNLTGNPLHEEQLEIVNVLGPVYSINTVIDEQRRLAFVNFGEVMASHQEAISFIEPFCRVAVPQRFDVVITSGAGYPLDKTYYQTVKGMVGAMNILEPGGDLIIASQCSEGFGSNEYRRAQVQLIRQGKKTFLESLRPKPLADIDEWQSQMQTRVMSIGNLYLYSELSSEDLALTGTEPLKDWAADLYRLTKGKSVAVIPEGPYVIPYVLPAKELDNPSKPKAG